MSLANFDGDGYADQPSIIYKYPDGEGNEQIRELARSGYAEPGPSPGDVIERDSTKSDLSDRLPELPIPGRDGLQQPDCGDDIPAFGCSDCGSPVYVGRTCGSPRCERCWASAVKDKVTRIAGKLEGMRRMLYARHDGGKDIDFNHVIASMPDFTVDSEKPTERALKVLKTLLEKKWYIEGFAAVYHPYRIKKEYRKDQYEHGGESGEGDMTWKDVLKAENPEEYIYHSPHFHLFFPAVRKSFDYSVAESVESETGWMFHRITKGEDSNVSVEDLDDLVHQLTYALSHSGVNDWNADRSELTTRMKGELHQCYAPDDVEDKVLASFCSAAPRLLGARFSNLSDSTCDANPDGSDSPIRDVWEPEVDIGVSRSSSARSAPITGGGSGGGSSSTDGSQPPTDGSQPSIGGSQSAADADSGDEGDTSDDGTTDNAGVCGGDLVPMSRAKALLDDLDWCEQAAYSEALRVAVDVWQSLDEDSKPWSGDSPDEDVIQDG